LEITSEKHGKAMVISVRGQIDTVSAPALDKQISDLIARNEENLIADLSELDYISSAGLRSFLIAAKELKSRNGRLVLACPKPEVMKIFRVSGFSAILTICDSIESAVAEI